VWVIAYVSVEWLFGHVFGFSGNGKWMSRVNKIISAILSGLLYGALEKFQVQIAWCVEHYVLIIIMFVIYIVIFEIIPEISDWICWRKQDKNNK
jgi:hypothetical protein